MPKPRRTHRRRPLAHFEPLEGRRLLASDLGQIVGTLVSDVGDTDVIASQTIQLFLDNGNGTFLEEDETPMGSATTNAAGEYTFVGLEEGDYFVRLNPTSGTLTEDGANVSALISISAADAIGNTNITIDDFTDAFQEAVVQRNMGDPVPAPDGQADGANANAGGARDLYSELTSGIGELSISANKFGIEGLSVESSVGVAGTARAVWDGVDADADAVDISLLDIDLTGAGANFAIQIDATADQSIDFRVRLHDTSGEIAEVTATVTDLDGLLDDDPEEEILLDFDDFLADNASIDLEHIGAIELVVDATGANALDALFDVVGVVGYTTETVAPITVYNELTLGDRVWLDLDNDGVLDPGEVGIDGVTLTLYEDANSDDSITGETEVAATTTSGGGYYEFDGLLPGDYLVRVDAGNFTGSGALVGLSTSTGNDVTGMAPDPDDSPVEDGTDKGTEQGDTSVLSKGITLAENSEPLVGVDGDDENGNQTVDFGFVPFDLTITKVDDDMDGTLIPGETVTYTIVASNVGPGPSTEVTLTDTLPAGLSFVSAGSDSPDGISAVVGGVTTLTYNLGVLASGEDETITVVATVDADVNGTLTNTATVSATGERSVLTNTASSSTTTETPLGSINGRVAIDVNGNDVLDSGDLPLANVWILLYDQADELVDMQMTDLQGRYEFTGLEPGTYRVVQQQPTGLADSNQTTGSAGADPVGVNTITNIFVDAGASVPVGPDNNFLEGLPTIGKRSFFWSTGRFSTLTS